MSAKPRPPQRRQGERKYDLPDFQSAAEPGFYRGLADHRRRCARSTCHQLLTIDEVAEVFSVSPRTVRRLIEFG